MRDLVQDLTPGVEPGGFDGEFGDGLSDIEGIGWVLGVLVVVSLCLWAGQAKRVQVNWGMRRDKQTMCSERNRLSLPPDAIRGRLSFVAIILDHPKLTSELRFLEGAANHPHG